MNYIIELDKIITFCLRSVHLIYFKRPELKFFYFRVSVDDEWKPIGLNGDDRTRLLDDFTDFRGDICLDRFYH